MYLLYYIQYMRSNFLKQFGFSDREFLIYHLLITNGPQTMSDIVQISRLHRPYAYKTVNLLIEKGAVTLRKDSHKKMYSPLSPVELKTNLEDLHRKASYELDLLQENYTAPHLETKVTHYQGKKGITSIFSDLVISQKKGDIFYRYTSEQDTDYANSFLPKDYRLIRDKKGLERFVISSYEATKTKKNRLERATKVIPSSESHFNQDCVQLIYTDKVAFINLTKKQGVIIEDKNIASFQKEIFKLLYKRL
jgi:sugar-specific transcriptional regulator TrmB